MRWPVLDQRHRLRLLAHTQRQSDECRRPLIKHLPDTAGKQILATMMYRGHDEKALVKQSLDLHWQPYARHAGPASLIKQAEALDVNDTLAVADALPSLDVPARIVWGADDKFQKIEYGERFAKDLNAPLRRIETVRKQASTSQPL